MIKGILQDNNFYCAHLSNQKKDENDISSFFINISTGLGLEQYLKYFSYPDEENHDMRTYLVRDIKTDELVAYFSLKAGLISINEKYDTNRISFDTIPGVEIANFAINSGYREKHKNTKGLGNVIFNHFIIPIIKEASETVGVRIVYIFALPINSLMNNYKKYGFTMLSDKDEEALHNRIKPSYDRSCIFMYMVL